MVLPSRRSLHYARNIKVFMTKPLEKKTEVATYNDDEQYAPGVYHVSRRRTCTYAPYVASVNVFSTRTSDIRFKSLLWGPVRGLSA